MKQQTDNYGGWTRKENLLTDEVYHHAVASVVFGTTGYLVVIGGRGSWTI